MKTAARIDGDVCHLPWSVVGRLGLEEGAAPLRKAGHEVLTPTYTGLGERAHQASPAVDLETHIKDVLAVIEYEDLSDIALVRHSYGGMVATGVADRVPERVQQVIYLDAFVPAHGQSVLDLRAPGPRPAATSPASENWLIPPNPAPPDTSAADLIWITPRRRPQPVRTFTQALQLRNPAAKFPRSYIYCTRKGPDDPFLQFSKRFKLDTNWRYYEIDASHSPNVTAPEALARLLCEIAR